MKTSLRLAFAAVALALLAACGAKGPLFLPTKDAPAETPAAPAETPATETTPTEAAPAEQPATEPTTPESAPVTPPSTPDARR
ncbi:sugar transporter [Pseudoxanthomonas helianthi]|uniref:Sugar transporter n=1 Tax=Pseudoxanthomonas helianthi TaxID=1453541 RepID=A0A940X1V9_9GAMM|nr:lipoprotein [Pseudoxanthomonas helianthi]MBP3984215.1 sugar transporter [Pseudoxanthomonas helianthi]